MAMAIRVSLLFFLFLSSSLLVFSLYEDQAGLADWHQQYLGKVKQAVFHTPKAGRKRLVVSTEESVIASLDLRRGEIFWRHVLGENDRIDHIDIALGKYVITLSSKGSIIRAWNLPDGQMVWESFLVGKKLSESSLLTVTDLKVERDNLILVYSNDCLHAISSVDGAVLWNIELKSVELQQLIKPVSGDVMYAVGISGSSKLHAYRFNIKTGELLNQDVVDFPGGLSGEISLVSSEILVALDASRTELVLISLKDGKISFQKTNIHDLVPQFSGEAALLPVNLEGIFAVKSNSYIVFLRVNDQSKLEVVDKIEDSSAVSGALSFKEDQLAFGIVQQGGSQIHLTVKLGSDYSTDILKESIQIDPNRGTVQKVFINNYIRADRSYGFRALVVMEDHSVSLLQQGNIVWSREDGLASIVDVTTSELPLEKKGVSVAKVEQGLLEWLKGHMLKLKGTLMLASAEDMVSIQALRLQSSEKSKLTRDHNGFRKLLIVLTKSGKVYALHTGDGRVVWSTFLPNLRKSDTCENPVALNLYQWQVPHHHAMDENPAVLVVGRCGNGIDAPGILSIVDTYSGKELSSLSLTHSVVDVIPLPFADSTEKRLHLIVDVDRNLHLYPKTPEAAVIFEREYINVYWYSVDAENNMLRGHGLKSKCMSEIADEFCFSSRDLWSIVFPSDSEKIIATVARKASEVVHTQAKVMADRNVLFKYISKNLLFVATVAPKGAGEIGSVTPDESWLVVYLIDTVTGRILHRVTHHGSQGPVRAVFSENWVVYHYFNLRANRYEISVIEIYDQSRADIKNVWKLILGKHNLTSPVSSYSRPEIMTKSQTYFFTHSVKTVSVTLTAKGITAKQLLIGTVGDQVLALDKRFLDPRRSAKPTPTELEDGIIPLTDALPINPQSYVTHALKVEGLRGIISVPAKLESTTLVFAYGADLYLTRLAPSKTYDSLTDEFSYALLLLTIVVLVAAIFVTWIMSERKDLRDKWR
ncbi:ER membrane protein complex subunit 1-like [Chenopodium quinoa]|uniref:ER membrane protein complex subunit 1-like n=1 Tax=Chenopodium quinoa TaxID=63459 RepID=UPI000B77B41C|nr:ER membrane protein complex subunit 1-like [Chenopodium quinoa]